MLLRNGWMHWNPTLTWHWRSLFSYNIRNSGYAIRICTAWKCLNTWFDHSPAFITILILLVSNSVSIPVQLQAKWNAKASSIEWSIVEQRQNVYYLLTTCARLHKKNYSFVHPIQMHIKPLHKKNGNLLRQDTQLEMSAGFSKIGGFKTKALWTDNSDFTAYSYVTSELEGFGTSVGVDKRSVLHIHWTTVWQKWACPFHFNYCGVRMETKTEWEWNAEESLMKC